MEHSFKIDWVTMTHVGDVEGIQRCESLSAALYLGRALMMLLVSSESQPTLVSMKPRRFYAYAWRDEATGTQIHLGADLMKQGVMVVMSSETLQKLPATPDLYHWFEVYGWRCTRIDGALDLFDTGIDTLDVANAYYYQHGQEGKRQTRLITSGSGNTFYAGARTSDRMLRVYDKGRQTGVYGDWLRLEVELKGNQAKIWFRDLMLDPTQSVLIITDILGLPDGKLMTILDALALGKVEAISTLPQPEPDRVKWFKEVVVSAFDKLFREDVDNALQIYDILGIVITDGLNRRSHGIAVEPPWISGEQSSE